MNVFGLLPLEQPALFGLLPVQQAFFAYIDAFTLRSSAFEFPLFLVQCLDLRE